MKTRLMQIKLCRRFPWGKLYQGHVSRKSNISKKRKPTFFQIVWSRIHQFVCHFKFQFRSTGFRFCIFICSHNFTSCWICWKSSWISMLCLLFCAPVNILFIVCFNSLKSMAPPHLSELLNFHSPVRTHYCIIVLIIVLISQIFLTNFSFFM